MVFEPRRNGDDGRLRLLGGERCDIDTSLMVNAPHAQVYITTDTQEMIGERIPEKRRRADCAHEEAFDFPRLNSSDSPEAWVFPPETDISSILIRLPTTWIGLPGWHDIAVAFRIHVLDFN